MRKGAQELSRRALRSNRGQGGSIVKIHAAAPPVRPALGRDHGVIDLRALQSSD